MNPSTRSRSRSKAVMAVLLTASLSLGAFAVGGSAAQAAPGDSTTHGLKGEYFLQGTSGSNDLGELKATQLDSAVNFPDLVPTYRDLTGRTENTAARWTGQIEPEFTEDYTFYAIGDNGFRVWIDGDLVIDHWVGDWDNEQTSAAVSLTAGQRYDIKVENFQAIGGANMFLRWSSASVPKQIIPAAAYYAPDGYPPFALDATIPADGESIALAFDEDLGGVTSGIVDHLSVSVDNSKYPVESIAIDGARGLEITLGTEVFESSIVRVKYDGAGALTLCGQALEAFDLPVLNGSTKYLKTEFADDVDTDNPLPEYPRPQLVRDEWKNLNGKWEFAGADANEDVPFGETLDETVVVPFAIESKLSGINRHEDHMFYKRDIEVPSDWNIGDGNRLQLNFGAVDYDATIYLNGEEVGHAVGGYLPFSVDLTDAIDGAGPQELIVAVTDTTSEQQPIGKQRANPSGIFYTPTSGIWQTVWIEPVPVVTIDKVVATPDLADGSVGVVVSSASAGTSDDFTITVREKNNGAIVGTATAKAGAEVDIAVPNAKLWSPDNPYLYDLDVAAAGGDAVDSYFGMRSIEISEVGGVQKIKLNGKPEFLLSTLDQGYWPESQYTQPTDEALKFDIQQTKDLKFNTIRKHIKIESARFYYYADTLGLMVWQDFVPGGTGAITNADAQDNLIDSMHDTVDALDEWTSIIGWTVFNEGWSEWSTEETGEITDAVKQQDPERLVNARSGLNCCNLPGDSGKGDVVDWHMYQGPGFPAPDTTRASVDGEHGGLSLVIPGHTWKGAFSPYGGFETSAALTDAYVKNTALMIEPARTFMSGAVYTQITDVEGEVNGFFTYDRKFEKMDFAKVRAVNQAVVDAGREAGTAVIDDGLVGEASYPLNEGSGTTSADVSGNDHDLTLRGGAGWTTEGKRGTALQLSGDGQYASTSVPVVDTTGDYTIAADVKLDRIPDNWATIASQEGSDGVSSFFLQYGHGGFAFSFPGERRATNEIVPELGKWYHLTGVWDAEKAEGSLYVNGVLADTVTAGRYSSVGRTVIGAAEFNNNVVDYWPGAIDEVHAYGRALSADEVTLVAAGDTAAHETATKVTLSKSTQTYGTGVTARVTVTTDSGAVAGGRVALYDGEKVLKSNVALGTGNTVALVLQSKLAIGSHSLHATYTPSATEFLDPSTSANITLKVVKATPVITTKFADSTIKKYTQTAKLTVKVKATAVNPVGTLRIYDGSKLIKVSQLRLSDKGIRTITLPTLAAGKHSIRVQYLGSDVLNAVKSGPRALVVRR